MTLAPPRPVAPSLWRQLAGEWPVLLIWAVTATVAVLQGTDHPTPWLFSDEIEYAQISRAIAETGEPARRGVEYWGAGLVPWLIAPFWWIDELGTAYAWVKAFNAVVMTAAVLPAYGLARLLVPRRYAIVAAAGTGIVPSLVYSAMVMQEPVAYFTASSAFFLIVRAIARPLPGRIAAAVAIALVAPFVRDQLVLVPFVLAGAAALRIACFGAGRRHLDGVSWRRRGAYAAAALVAAAAAIAILRAGSGQWKTALGDPGVMLDQALWAWAALAIGIGVLPAVVGLASIAPSRAVPRTPALEAFVAVLAVAVAGFTVYVAVKGAYQAAVFEPVHGSAPKYAGQNKANPTALILSGALMLRHLGEVAAAERVEGAVRSVIAEGAHVTYDMGGTAGTSDFADAVIGRLEAASVSPA